MDGGGWWAMVHRVTKSHIQLKRLSTYARAHTHTYINNIGNIPQNWLLMGPSHAIWKTLNQNRDPLVKFSLLLTFVKMIWVGHSHTHSFLYFIVSSYFHIGLVATGIVLNAEAKLCTIWPFTEKVWQTGKPRWPVVKKPPTNVWDTRDASPAPGSERSPRVGNGNWLQHSCLKNPRTEKPGSLQSTG